MQGRFDCIFWTNISNNSSLKFVKWIFSHFVIVFHQLSLFLYPLKTENQWFPYYFKKYRKRTVVWNELKKSNDARTHVMHLFCCLAIFHSSLYKNVWQLSESTIYYFVEVFIREGSVLIPSACVDLSWKNSLIFLFCIIWKEVVFNILIIYIKNCKVETAFDWANRIEQRPLSMVFLFLFFIWLFSLFDLVFLCHRIFSWQTLAKAGF